MVIRIVHIRQEAIWDIVRTALAVSTRICKSSSVSVFKKFQAINTPIVCCTSSIFGLMDICSLIRNVILVEYIFIWEISWSSVLIYLYIVVVMNFSFLKTVIELSHYDQDPSKHRWLKCTKSPRYSWVWKCNTGLLDMPLHDPGEA